LRPLNPGQGSIKVIDIDTKITIPSLSNGNPIDWMFPTSFL